MLVANLFRIQTVWSGITGAPYYTTMFCTSDGLTAGAQAAVNAVDSFWESLVAQIRSGLTWNIDGQVEEIDEVTGNLVGAYPVLPQNGVGTSATDILSKSTCGLIQWHTGVIVNRRLLKGRTFVPLPCEGQNDVLGVPTAAYKSQLGLAAAALITNPNIELKVWSRTHGQSEVVTGSSVWAEWANLRTHRD